MTLKQMAEAQKQTRSAAPSLRMSGAVRSNRSGVRAEQQALAKWGLNYVIDQYLPIKLANESSFLP